MSIAMTRTAAIRLPVGMEYVDAPYVTRRLEEAGKVLMCLRVSGCRPADYKVAWPAIVQEVFTAMDMEDVPLPEPHSAQVTAMDEAFAWIALVGDIKMRRLIWLRLLVHPISDRYKWTWRALEKIFGLDHQTLKARHGRGIALIATKLNQPDFRELPGGSLP